MPYLTLAIRFGEDGEHSAPTLEHASVGFSGAAPPEGTISGSEAVKAAAFDLFNAATAQQQETLRQAVLQHLKDSLP